MAAVVLIRASYGTWPPVYGSIFQSFGPWKELNWGGPVVRGMQGKIPP
jgi:hypothetical protein